MSGAQQGRVTSDGAEIAWWSWGSGEPVLLVMGLGVDHRGWILQIEDLQAHYRVIAFDNRGIGQSSVPKGAYTTTQMARDALAVLTAAGEERAHVVGVSLGGMIAQKIALLAPERVRTLALLATHGGGLTALPSPDTAYLFRQLQSARSDDERRDAMFKILFPETFLMTHRRRILAETARLGSNLFLQQSPTGYQGQTMAALSHYTGRRLRALEGTPALVMTGLADRAVRPINTRLLHGWMPWARRVELPDVGHGLNFQAAGVVHDELARLFAQA